MKSHYFLQSSKYILLGQLVSVIFVARDKRNINLISTAGYRLGETQGNIKGWGFINNNMQPFHKIRMFK